MGPIKQPVKCSESVFASFSPTQFSFSHPALRCLNRKCICAHLCAHGTCWSENEVCSGALLVRFYFEELKIDCVIDQLKPGLKSMAQYIYVLLFKECFSRKCASGQIHNVRSLCLLLHTATRSSTQTCQI